jgi:predicted site-specific integrase-resolvase
MERNTEIHTRLGWGLAELSKSLGVSIAFLRNEQRAGRLPVKRLGRRVIVTTDDLKLYLERASETPTWKPDSKR